jgi:periplasmic protein TonB
MNSQPPENLPAASSGPHPSDNLDRLSIPGVEEPWHRSLARNLKEALRPAPLPPLEVTSKPLEIKDIWGDYRYGRQAGLTSLAIHLAVIALLFTLGASRTVRTVVQKSVVLIAPNLADYMPDLPPKNPAPRGGGGGDRSPLPASRGQLPRFASKQFVPPEQVRNNPNPALLIEPTLIGPSDARVPHVDMPVWGDPLAKLGPYSNGRGRDGGIGDGCCGGIGPGSGPSYGPDEGIGPGVFRLGTLGVSAPIPIYKVEPEYSEEARKAKFQGTVEISIVIDERGMPTNIRILRPLGLGLDQKAVEAVSKWRFRPGMKDGRPVAVVAKVDVSFRLL